MEKVFNKLVRDNIPNIIKNNGDECETRILDDEEYKLELKKKLLEEAKEVIDSETKEDTLCELADVYELIFSISKILGSNIEEVASYANKKRNKNGGFEEKIYLIKTFNDKDSL